MKYKVLMPKELTAENGAKGLLSGEFFIDVEMRCTACFYDTPQDECEVCCGEVDYTERKAVDWTTIKEIYAMAVKHLAMPDINREE